MAGIPIAASPARYARLAGLFYLGTIVAGTLAVVLKAGAGAANVIASLCYVAVTVLFYFLFEPVHRALSLTAAGFSLVGCVVGAASSLEIAHIPINSLVIFGVYCLLIGSLIVRSTFLPRILGVLMAIGGAGWLTFAWPELSSRLAPFNMLPGVIGETALTIWLLVKGVDAAKWRAQASARPSG
jgi:hypothetical protein